MIGDPVLEMHSLVSVGEMQLRLSHFDASRSSFELALDLAARCGSGFEQANVLNSLGLVSFYEGKFQEAMDWLVEARRGSAAVGNARLEGVVEVNLSRVCYNLGRYADAVRHAELSLRERERDRDPEGEAFARTRMARALMCLGEYQRAIGLCRKALTVAGNAGYPPSEAETLDTLGELLRLTGQLDEAVDCWRQALVILERLGAEADALRVRQRLSALS